VDVAKLSLFIPISCKPCNLSLGRDRLPNDGVDFLIGVWWFWLVGSFLWFFNETLFEVVSGSQHC
jgi:hypothetical protein